ncbi:hypothetical protein BDK51DRAFT_48262 [Blyttiomyces helicus]|uniref:Uncharacterized protein n=1 Tax=Blyttiomyces helicus TaxID=388810 RepID=A0A4V1IPJ3_9FUNG|nr:hypothetical protein BDK51DRAFT_48262 [Blyttiomyces helicus]|eukprot:RKO83257.1 hypothetical protein BDK51DRAFT_48262 [Blyttiomyces helicus]
MKRFATSEHINMCCATINSRILNATSPCMPTRPYGIENDDLPYPNPPHPHGGSNDGPLHPTILSPYERASSHSNRQLDTNLTDPYPFARESQDRRLPSQRPHTYQRVPPVELPVWPRRYPVEPMKHKTWKYGRSTRFGTHETSSYGASGLGRAQQNRRRVDVGWSLAPRGPNARSARQPSNDWVLAGPPSRPARDRHPKTEVVWAVVELRRLGAG